MEKTHCIAGCTYYTKAENLKSVLQTGCFHLLENNYGDPWWKKIFKKKRIRYSLLCIKPIDIYLGD